MTVELEEGWMIAVIEQESWVTNPEVGSWYRYGIQPNKKKSIDFDAVIGKDLEQSKRYDSVFYSGGELPIV